MAKQVESLIKATWIIPVEPAGVSLTEHALVVDAGQIVAVLPAARALEQFTPETVLDLQDHVIIPGLINAHTHAAMSLFRGIADDLPLMQWLQEHIWPAEQRWISPEFVRDGTRHAVAEMLRSGTTCFNDMYFFPDEAAKAAVEFGMRVMIGLIVIDFPTTWAKNADEYFDKAMSVRQQLLNTPLVHTCYAPHAPYTVSDAGLLRVASLAQELNTPITIHLHETSQEIENAVATTGERPFQRLKRLGLVSSRLLAVHMTQVEDSEFDQLARHGVNVVHCPESNMKLASGSCPVQKLCDAGVNVALGTDGAASNNDLDMLAEMRSAALFGKIVAADGTAVPAANVLRMATLNGANALGIEHKTGSLQVGKAADLVSIDLSGLSVQPVYDPLSQLVYSATRSDVANVWVAGERLLADGEFTKINSEAIRQRSRQWADRISAHRAQAAAPD